MTTKRGDPPDPGITMSGKGSMRRNGEGASANMPKQNASSNTKVNGWVNKTPKGSGNRSGGNMAASPSNNSAPNGHGKWG